MDKNFTLNELSEFTAKEKRELKSLGLVSQKTLSPSEESILNILNFSRALSVRKRKGGNYFEFVLN